MLKNYLTIVYRNLFKQRTSSLINIAGLAIAIACCLFILLFIFDELQYDKFNLNKDRICRVVFQNHQTGDKDAIMPAVLFPSMMSEIPEFENGFRISKWPEVSVANKEKVFSEDVYFADQEIFNVFTFPLKRGNPESALREPFSVVVTEAIAKKYFGNADPIGKTLRLLNKYDFRVTGILKSIPQHSHIRPDIIASLNSFNTIEPRMFSDITYSGSYFYFLLKNNASPDAVENKLKKIFKERYGKDAVNIAGFALEPLSDIYLYSADTRWDIASHGNIKYVQSFAVIALLILVMASFNYTNLLTVLVKIREKEFAVRKLLGAGRKGIINQFLMETISYLFISLFIALVLVELFMNGFNQLTGKQLNFNSLFHWQIMLSIFGLIFLATVSSIIYPAIIAIKSDNLCRLKGSTYGSRLKPSNFQFGFRQVVIGLQFVITISLIAGTIIIFNQMNYMQNTNLGFNKEHLLSITNPYDKDMYSRYENFKNEIKQYPQVLDVTASGNVPSENVNNYTQVWIRNKKENDGVHSGQIAVDYDFFKTMQARFISGRDFSREYKSDVDGSVILNREAVKALNLKNPIGAELSGINNASDPQKVIGVIEDIHFMSFKEKVPPIIFFLRQWSASNIVLRLKGDDIVSTMKFLEKEWHSVVPDQPFIYSFLDKSFDNLYKSEQQTSTVILVFCLFAIAISSIGLFSIVSLLSQTRKKEIGVRKVLGASISNVVFMMMREYFLIIAAANIIAWPVAYYFMNKWLQNFAYHIDINWWVFILSGLSALIIALFTVSFQAIKAATANPVKSLRYE